MGNAGGEGAVGARKPPVAPEAPVAPNDDGEAGGGGGGGVMAMPKEPRDDEPCTNIIYINRCALNKKIEIKLNDDESMQKECVLKKKIIPGHE